VIYDVVPAAEVVLVEFKVELVRAGERNTYFPEYVYDLVAPVVDVARGRYGGEVFPGYDVQLGDSAEIEGAFRVDIGPPARWKILRPITKSAKGYIARFQGDPLRINCISEQSRWDG
jgi:hypothetical protein